MFNQILAGSGILLDAAGRRDVVGRHRVAENPQRPRPGNVADRSGMHRELLEERRLLDVRACCVPMIHRSDRCWDFIPCRVLRGEILVQRAEYLRLEGCLHGVANLLQRRPEVAQVNALGDRFGRQINVHAPGQR